MSEPVKAKYGAGHAQAMGRMGWQELRNAAYTGSNVATSGEAGLYGTATPQEVHEQRMSEPQLEVSPLEAAMQRANDRANAQTQTQKQTIQP